MIQIGGVHTTFCQEEGILLQKYRDRNGRCIMILSKSVGVRGRFYSPDFILLINSRGLIGYPEGWPKHRTRAHVSHVNLTLRLQANTNNKNNEHAKWVDLVPLVLFCSMALSDLKHCKGMFLLGCTKSSG